jgi:ArsR family transcriptional regulator
VVIFRPEVLSFVGASERKTVLVLILIICTYTHIFPLTNYEQAKARADILKALAHPIRVLLLDALSRGDRCVNELNELADVDQSTISRHLAQLKEAGIVTERKEGSKVIHHLACPCMLQAFDCSVEVLKITTKRRLTALKGV